MNTYAVKVTDYALAQMQEITDYVSQTLQAPQAAHRLLAALKSGMASCAELPTINPLLLDEPWRSEGIRKIIVKNFYAYYWINEDNREVWFIAVVYAKRSQAEELLKAILS